MFYKFDSEVIKVLSEKASFWLVLLTFDGLYSFKPIHKLVDIARNMLLRGYLSYFNWNCEFILAFRPRLAMQHMSTTEMSAIIDRIAAMTTISLSSLK